MAEPAAVAGRAEWGSACARDTGPSLPELKLDPARTAVAGLSSGAYMASQAQLAYPELFPNAALVAGGPYGCADGQPARALGSCMKGMPAPDVSALLARATARSAAGENGVLKDLAHARVYLLHGTEDAWSPLQWREAARISTSSCANGMPGLNGMQVHDDSQRAFAHNLPVAASGDDCGTSAGALSGPLRFRCGGRNFRADVRQTGASGGDRARGDTATFDQDALRPAMAPMRSWPAPATSMCLRLVLPESAAA